MGLQSASLECINGKHITRQRYCFLRNARSALGFAPDSPLSAPIALLHRILTKTCVLVRGKNSSFQEIPESWKKNKTKNLHEVVNSRPGHTQPCGACCDRTRRSASCLVPSQGDDFAEEIQTLSYEFVPCPEKAVWSLEVTPWQERGKK